MNIEEAIFLCFMGLSKSKVFMVESACCDDISKSFLAIIFGSETCHRNNRNYSNFSLLMITVFILRAGLFFPIES